MRMAFASFVTTLALIGSIGWAESSADSADGRADLSSSSTQPTGGGFDRRNLTEDRAKVASFVETLLGGDRIPAEVPHVEGTADSEIDSSK